MKTKTIKIFKVGTGLWEYEIHWPSDEPKGIGHQSTGWAFTRRGAERKARRQIRNRTRTRKAESEYTIEL